MGIKRDNDRLSLPFPGTRFQSFNHFDMSFMNTVKAPHRNDRAFDMQIVRSVVYVHHANYFSPQKYNKG